MLALRGHHFGNRHAAFSPAYEKTAAKWTSTSSVVVNMMCHIYLVASACHAAGSPMQAQTSIVEALRYE